MRANRVDLLERVEAYIEEHSLLPERAGVVEIVVAVSGGADSLCLLHVLHRLCGPGKRFPEVRLRVAHLNHKLREEAGVEAQAVKSIASEWGLPITIGEVDVPALAREEGRSLEEAAREARYRFLREVAHGQPIAVAHHADDQVETLLLHLLRGGGLSSMVGMQPRQQDIIRPLLAITHAETVAYCREHSLMPLEDSSNADPRFLRNRVRHELLPLLESLNPGIRATLLRNAEVARLDAEWIEEQVSAHWPGVVLEEQEHFIELSVEKLLALPLSLQRHLLRRVTACLSGGQSPLELRHYQLVEQLLRREPQPDQGQGSKMLNLPQGLRVTYNFRTVTFDRLFKQNVQGELVGVNRVQQQQGGTKVPIQEPSASISAPVRLPIPGRVAVPGTSWVAVAEVLPDELLHSVREALGREEWPKVWRLLPSTRYAIYIDAEIVGPSLEVRTRRAGDRIRPLGMAQEKKVKDMLIDKHIPRAERDHIPLFFSPSHCVWLAGVSLDDRVRLTRNTQHIIRLSVEPILSSKSG
jgi:tRNA(Ile)-lysidine synthase